MQLKFRRLWQFNYFPNPRLWPHKGDAILHRIHNLAERLLGRTMRKSVLIFIRMVWAERHRLGYHGRTLRLEVSRSIFHFLCSVYSTSCFPLPGLEAFSMWRRMPNRPTLEDIQGKNNKISQTSGKLLHCKTFVGKASVSFERTVGVWMLMACTPAWRENETSSSTTDEL